MQEEKGTEEPQSQGTEEPQNNDNPPPQEEQHMPQEESHQNSAPAEATEQKQDDTLAVEGVDGEEAVLREGEDTAHQATLRRDTEVPLSFVIAKLKTDIEASALMKDLLIFIPFLIMFVFFFLAGRKIESNFYVLKGVRDRVMMTEFPVERQQLDLFRSQVLAEKMTHIELDKYYTEIGNSGDWQDWFQDVIVPTIWDCTYPDLSHSVLSPFGQNYHVGAIRVRTQRMKPNSCDVRSDIYPSNNSDFPQICYAKHDRWEEEKSLLCNFTNPLKSNERMFTYRDPSDVPGMTVSAVEGVYHPGGYMFEIPFNATCNDAMKFAALVQEDCAFVDTWATRFIIVEYFIYTPQTDTFHAVKLYVEVLAGGAYYPQYMFRSFQMWTSDKIGQTIFDFFFLAFIIYYWFAFFYEFVMWMKDPEKTLIGFITEFWHLLELTNLITFVVVFGLRWAWWGTSVKADSIKIPFDPQYPDHLDDLLQLYNSQMYANSVNTILTFLKLLKYVQLNERLNVLTRTISMCQQSIFGVLVLFVFVIVGYGITAWTLFGINIEGFRNLGVSMSTLVRMLVGDIDYEAMRNENRFLAGAFFWSFVILALFLLLNFLIAIISEAFAKVSGKAYSLSFDEVIVRWLQSTKQFLKPSNVKRMVGNFFKGKSEPTLLRRSVDDLKRVKEEKEREQADAAALRRETMDDKDALMAQEEEEYIVKMRRSDWAEWIDSEVYEDLGDYFFDYTWDDILNDYDDAQKSSEEVDKRHMYETVQTGAQKVIGEDIRKVHQLDQMLTALETEVARIMNAVSAEK